MALTCGNAQGRKRGSGVLARTLLLECFGEYPPGMAKREWDQPAAFDVPANMPGTDEPAPEGVVIRRIDGQAVVLPRSLRNLDGEAVKAAARLQLLARQRVDIDEELEYLVGAGRAAGLSWNALGWCLGVTGDAVRKAYGQ